VVTHPVGVAPNVNDMAVVQDPVDQRRGHDLIPQDLAPFVEPFVGGQNRGGVLVAPAHELKEQHGAGLSDRDVAYGGNDPRDRRSVGQAGANRGKTTVFPALPGTRTEHPQAISEELYARVPFAAGHGLPKERVPSSVIEQALGS
jgi:hypothetical protein